MKKHLGTVVQEKGSRGGGGCEIVLCCLLQVWYRMLWQSYASLGIGVTVARGQWTCSFDPIGVFLADWIGKKGIGMDLHGPCK